MRRDETAFESIPDNEEYSPDWVPFSDGVGRGSTASQLASVEDNRTKARCELRR